MITNYGDIGEINTQRVLDKVHAQRAGGGLYADIGVRFGVTSKILLEDSLSQNYMVLGVDVCDCPVDLKNKDRYIFTQADSVTWLAQQHSLKFDGAIVDTLHIKEQVMCELYYLWPKIKVGGWVAFHDTAWPQGKCDRYLDRDWERTEVGVANFFRTDHHFPKYPFDYDNTNIKMEHNPDSWGLTIVTKKTEFDYRENLNWTSIFMHRNNLLHLLDGTKVPREVYNK